MTLAEDMPWIVNVMDYTNVYTTLFDTDLVTQISLIDLV
jgi:hypothetical protein